ncbi:hypothetical protein CAEBREN_23004 [Caenorhabditis brenneri]|uniref:Receptor L-domain domain-containing protein n=1 Tax=Caenorhabditis brenneri TaxID=135651 RepID=G0MU92_CAEBE|nr:hypothetical protein CAEBREN_23004 [Caenorhabditis brenneri]
MCIQLHSSELNNHKIFPEVQKDGVYILNNSNLYDANLLMTTDFLFDNKENRECEVRIEDNKILDSELLCDDGYFERYMDLKIKGNSKDCGCQGDEITPTSLPDYRKCKTLYRGLKLQNITDPTAATHLSGIRIIKGSIDIQNTNLQNLSFLEKFQRSEINNNGVVEKISFNLKDNPNMTRLALPGFEEIHNYAYDGMKLANFENLHPDFCLTYAEIIQLLERELTFMNFHVKLCDGSPDIPGQKVCIYESMAKLPNNCDVIIGDIVVDSGDEVLFMKLDVFNYLFGSLTIRNTNLKFLDGLAGLHAIIHLNPGPVIKVISNKEMIMKREELKFVGPSFIYTRNRSNRDVAVQDNNPNIFNEFEGKCIFYYWIEYREEREYHTNMNFTGGDCGQRMEITNLDIGTTVYVTLLLIGLILIK